MARFKKQFIRDFLPSQPIQDVFLVSEAQRKQARNGPYWHVKLQDATGSVEGKIWSPLSGMIGSLTPGMFVEITGNAEVYNDQLTARITHLHILDSEETADLDREEFLHACARRPEEMYERLLELTRTMISYVPLRKLLVAILSDEDIHSALLVAYAAKKMHHAFPGGLLQHTLGVAELVLAIADQYPALDRQILLAGAICHDLGKLKEIASSDLTADYTDCGQLLGHVQLGLELVDSFLRKYALEEDIALHLRHLIISHHGFLEYGSPKIPMTAEAFVLHFADNIDAKLAQFETIVAEGGLKAGEWSSYQKSLERSLYVPMPTPTSAQPGASRKPELKDTQCSLLSKA